MQTPSTDVMGGERARAIAAQPMAVAPIFDPTDVRCARRRAGVRTPESERRLGGMSHRPHGVVSRHRDTTS
jgi:hypothetical protein